jgi:Staphylococcus phage HNH endonuclease
VTRNANGQIKRDDLSGKRFGRLVVLRFSHISKTRKTYWVCKCDCGRTKRARADSLLDGAIIACGCVGKARRRAACTKHGKNRRTARSPVYSAFFRLRNLCCNHDARDFWCYGGRGCEFHFSNFQELLDAVGEKPGPEYRLERKDKDGHIEVGNLQWVPIKRRLTSRRRQVVNHQTPVAHKT